MRNYDQLIKYIKVSEYKDHRTNQFTLDALLEKVLSDVFKKKKQTREMGMKYNLDADNYLKIKIQGDPNIWGKYP